MKYESLLAQMTLEEKASLCSGANYWNTKSIERLGIPSMVLTDGPHGVRKMGNGADHLALTAADCIPATCFPTACAAANTWNQELLEEMGTYFGDEVVAEDVSVILGPGVNIKRSPLCGRNFEYYSEDPYLAGKLSAAMIRGIQSKGVVACVKHFAANSQELYRMTNDSVMDERTLREIYLPAFEIAVREGGVRCLMTSYNSLNGTYTNEHPHLLQDILFVEWDYRGMIVTDWGGNNDRVEALKMGDHLEMPGTDYQTDKQIVEAVRSGELDEKLLDQRVDVLLDILFSTKKALEGEHSYDVEKHHRVAARVAEECAVLLKNEEGLLPLQPDKTVAVIGDFAQTPRYQGAGSSSIVPNRLDNGLDALKAAKVKVVGYEPGFKRMGQKSDKLLRSAVELAGKADIALLWLGLDEATEAECVDRENMKLPENQQRLLEEVSKVNPNVVVVLSCGSPVEMDWDTKAKAVLHGYLPGQAGATALVRLLTGEANPSGKLAETYPMKLEDTPCHHYYPGPEATAEYREGIFVGYRYYDKAGVPVKYPFGYGLSYTRFEYSDLEATESEVRLTVKNVGERAGAETVQVYVAAPDSQVFRPEKELKGFGKLFLEPGESRRLTIPLDKKAFSYFNIAHNAWTQEAGTYKLLVGSSSRDIRLEAPLKVDGVEPSNPYEGEQFKPYFEGKVQQVPDESFAALLGHEIPPTLWDPNARLTANSPIAQGKNARGFSGRLLYRLINLARKYLLLRGKRTEANNIMFVLNMPYRNFVRMGGIIKETKMEAFLKTVNREKGGWKELLFGKKAQT